MHRHERWPQAERLLDERIDLLDHRIRHGEAADGRAPAVHQDVRAAARLRLVELVGEPEIERARPAPDVVDLRARDRIEAFRRLLVALAPLWAKRARPVAHRIGRKQHEAVVLAEPHLELGFGLNTRNSTGAPGLMPFSASRSLRRERSGVPGNGSEPSVAARWRSIRSLATSLSSIETAPAGPGA